MLDSSHKDKFQSLMRKLESQNNYLDAINQASIQYSIRPYNIDKLTPEKVRQLYDSITNKFKIFLSRANRDTIGCWNLYWAENQLRIYLWVLIGYSFITCKPIKSMDVEDWKYFSSMFRKEDQLLFEFQARSILKNQNKLLKWELSETAILQQIINSRSYKKKWNQIAKELFIRSEKKYFRTGKQCRQHWLNHLDPVKLHTPWTNVQDQILITHVLEYGKKWSSIVKALNGKRTEHMVKNRFKSLLNFESKNHPQSKEVDVIKIIKEKLQNNIDIKSSCTKRKKRYNTESNSGLVSSQLSQNDIKEEKAKFQFLQYDKSQQGERKEQNITQDPHKKTEPIQQEVEKSPSIFWNFPEGNQHQVNQKFPSFALNQRWDIELNFQDMILLGNPPGMDFDKD